MGFLCLSAKFMKSLQFIYWNNVWKNLVPQRGLLGQCQEHWFRATLESKPFFHSLLPLWSSEGQLTFLSLSSLNYKVGMIMGYNMDITINNVRKCSIVVTLGGGSWTSSINTLWELTGNDNSWVSSQIYWTNNTEVRAQKLLLQQTPQVILMGVDIYEALPLISLGKDLNDLSQHIIILTCKLCLPYRIDVKI